MRTWGLVIVLMLFVVIGVLLAILLLAPVGRWAGSALVLSLPKEQRTWARHRIQSSVTIEPDLQGMAPVAPEVVRLRRVLAEACAQAGLAPVEAATAAALFPEHRAEGATSVSVALERLYRRFDTDRSSEDYWTSVSTFLEEHRREFDQISAAVQELATCPGYAMESVVDTDMGRVVSLGAIHCRVFYDAGKLLTLRSRQFARAGDYTAASHEAVEIMLMCRGRKGADLIGQLIAVQLENLASRCLSRLCKGCTDPVLLRKLVSVMDEVTTEMTQVNMSDAPVTDMIGALRQARRAGAAVDLSSPQPYANLFDQWIASMQHGEAPFWNAPSFPHDEQNAFRLFMFSNFARPSSSEATTREKTAAGLFHLTRLALATRLSELERGRLVSGAADLIPAYLATVPQDPFSSTPLSWSPEKKWFYSVAPDRRDGRADTLYDPTNGTLSSGDLFLSVD